MIEQPADITSANIKMTIRIGIKFLPPGVNRNTTISPRQMDMIKQRHPAKIDERLIVRSIISRTPHDNN
jgi:hypothetical protein